MPVDPFSLPFEEAIRFFRGKGLVTSAAWTDLWQGEHAKAFTVAGATKDALLADLHAAVTKAVEKGATLAEFRKDFDALVAQHGWDYRGGRNWRTRTIWQTNVRTAYMAGRHQQLLEGNFPYWQYVHSHAVKDPRPEHLEWDGLILRSDDPWWKVHFPPNGWGCMCSVRGVTPREMAKRGKDGPDPTPSDNVTRRTVGGVEREVHSGVDPGWAYNVGEAWGPQLQTSKMADPGPWVASAGKAPADFGRPAKIPLDKPKAALGQALTGGRAPADAEALRQALRDAIGGDQALFTDPAGGTVLVTQGLVDHQLASAARLDGREVFFPLIPELVEDPFEIWVALATSEATGRVALRRRYVKALDLGGGKVLGLVAESEGGVWVALTFFRGKTTGIKGLREGWLVWGR